MGVRCQSALMMPIVLLFHFQRVSLSSRFQKSDLYGNIDRHVSPVGFIGAECKGNGTKKGASSQSCKKVELQLELPTGVEAHAVQLYCYERVYPIGAKARVGSKGICKIPRTKYCNTDEQCRPGTACRISSQRGYKTCEAGNYAGDLCQGNDGRGNCAPYSWAPKFGSKGHTFTSAKLYCISMDSSSPEQWSYAKHKDVGVCKVWKDQACNVHDDCMFGLFCLSSTCKYGNPEAYAAWNAALAVNAAQAALDHLHVDGPFSMTMPSDRCTDEALPECRSSLEYEVFTPLAAASLNTERDRNATEALSSVYVALQSAFVSLFAFSGGKASRSGSKMYKSSDGEWIFKQVRKSEFKALTGPVLRLAREQFARSKNWGIDDSLGVLQGSLLNLPVLAINPGRWVVLRNVVNHHQQLLFDDNKGLPQTYDVKPPPARSYEREQFLAMMLAENDGRGVDLGSMLQFNDVVLPVLHHDLYLLEALQLVDYSILFEVYRMDSVDISHLGKSCIAKVECKTPSSKGCIVICMTIIDWLRPFAPGDQFTVDAENAVKGGKFSAYASKAKLFIECAATFGSSYTPLQASSTRRLDSGQESAYVPFKHRSSGNSSLSTLQEVEGLPEDACTTRWLSEHSVDLDLIESACKPFVKGYVGWHPKNGLDSGCTILQKEAATEGACQDLLDCHVAESCSLYLFGTSIGCSDVPVIGTLQMGNILTRCSHYVSKACNQDFDAAAKAYMMSVTQVRDMGLRF